MVKIIYDVHFIAVITAIVIRLIKIIRNIKK